MHLVKTISPMSDREGLRGFSIDPGETAFVPTGLIFDIPEDFKLAIYPRSGSSGKKHLRLGNCVAVIDEDYTSETMIILFNNSETRQSICHGDRLAQAEIVPVFRANFNILENKIAQKTDRTGGLGHTGLQV